MSAGREAKEAAPVAVTTASEKQEKRMTEKV